MKFRCIVLALLVSTISATYFEDQQKELLWYDNFNTKNITSPNDEVWNIDDGSGPSGIGNGQIQTFSDSLDHVRLEDGKLYLTATRSDDNKEILSAAINTQNKVTFKYGTVVALIKAPDVDAGLWPAFWTMGNVWTLNGENGGLAWPASGSMNAMELGQGQGLVEGLGNKRVVSAFHWMFNGTHASYAGKLDYNTTLTKYYSYALEWTPERITTYIEDTKIWTMDIRPEVCKDCEEFHREHFIVFDLAVGGGFTTAGCDSLINMDCGPVRTLDQVTAPLPAVFKVEYVRVYDNNGQTTVRLGDGTIIGKDPTETTTEFPVPAPFEPPVEVPTAPVETPVEVPTAPVDVPVDVPTAPVETPVEVPTAPVEAPVEAPTAPVEVPVASSPVVAPFTVAPVPPFTVAPVAAPVVVDTPVADATFTPTSLRDIEITGSDAPSLSPNTGDGNLGSDLPSNVPAGELSNTPSFQPTVNNGGTRGVLGQAISAGTSTNSLFSTTVSSVLGVLLVLNAMR